MSFNSENISNPIIRRAYGTYTYMLPSVVDDMDFNITHVIRGEDHISNTAVQIQMLNALKQIYLCFHIYRFYILIYVNNLYIPNNDNVVL